MKGTYDKIYSKLAQAHNDLLSSGTSVQKLALIGVAPPSKKNVIRDLAQSIPHKYFGKDYFDAMTIVMQSHWLVSLTIDIVIGDFLMPGTNMPKRSILVFDVLFQVPFHAKVGILEKHSLIPKNQLDNLGRINSLRNGFAHFYKPTDTRMHYRKIPIVSEAGLERFWRDCEDVNGACLNSVK